MLNLCIYDIEIMRVDAAFNKLTYLRNSTLALFAPKVYLKVFKSLKVVIKDIFLNCWYQLSQQFFLEQEEQR